MRERAGRLILVVADAITAGLYRLADLVAGADLFELDLAEAPVDYPRLAEFTDARGVDLLHTGRRPW